jgi:hypothetical protein
LVRARGSYPRRRWFDSTHRHQISHKNSAGLSEICKLSPFSTYVVLYSFMPLKTVQIAPAIAPRILTASLIRPFTALIYLVVVASVVCLSSFITSVGASVFASQPRSNPSNLLVSAIRPREKRSIHGAGCSSG